MSPNLKTSSDFWKEVADQLLYILNPFGGSLQCVVHTVHIWYTNLIQRWGFARCHHLARIWVLLHLPRIACPWRLHGLGGQKLNLVFFFSKKNKIVISHNTYNRLHSLLSCSLGWFTIQVTTIFKPDGSEPIERGKYHILAPTQYGR